MDYLKQGIQKYIDIINTSINVNISTTKIEHISKNTINRLTMKIMRELYFIVKQYKILDDIKTIKYDKNSYVEYTYFCIGEIIKKIDSMKIDEKTIVSNTTINPDIKKIDSIKIDETPIVSNNTIKPEEKPTVKSNRNTDNLFGLLNGVLGFDTINNKKQEINIWKRFTENDLTKKCMGGMDNFINDIYDNIFFSSGYTEQEREILGLTIEKGVIFHGPPGTGKTMLSIALAKKIISTTGLYRVIKGPELTDMLVGQTEKNIRYIFDIPKDKLCVIIIDEIDSLLPVRRQTNNGHNESMVSQFLTMMDGPDNSNHKNLIIIGTTNRIDMIDPAALRPGRFGTKYHIDNPNDKLRNDIFHFYIDPMITLKMISNDIDFNIIVKESNGLSCADISHIHKKLARIYINNKRTKMIDIDDIIPLLLKEEKHDELNNMYI